MISNIDGWRQHEASWSWFDSVEFLRPRYPMYVARIDDSGRSDVILYEPIYRNMVLSRPFDPTLSCQQLSENSTHSCLHLAAAHPHFP